MNTSVAPSSTGFGVNLSSKEGFSGGGDWLNTNREFGPSGGFVDKPVSNLPTTNVKSTWTPQDTIGAINAGVGVANLGLAWYGNKQSKDQFRDSIKRTDKNIANQVQTVNSQLRDKASHDAYEKHGLTGAARDAYVANVMRTSGVTDMSGRGLAAYAVGSPSADNRYAAMAEARALVAAEKAAAEKAGVEITSTKDDEKDVKVGN
jgi:hypothetical protein